MFRDLHTLKLVLPGTPRSTVGIAQRSVAYLWPCDCLAVGIDEAALEVRCCTVHTELLAAGTSPRGAIESSA